MNITAPFIKDVVFAVIDRVFKKKMSEKEAKLIQIELDKIIADTYQKFMKEETGSLESARKFDLAMVNTLPMAIRWISGAVRPIIAITVLCVWLGNIFQSGFVLTAFDYTIIMAVITFYFGARTFEKKSGISNNR